MRSIENVSGRKVVQESTVILFDERGAAFQALRFGDRGLIARDGEMLRPALGIGTLKGRAGLRHYSRGFLSSEEPSENTRSRAWFAPGLLRRHVEAGEIVSGWCRDLDYVVTAPKLGSVRFHQLLSWGLAARIFRFCSPLPNSAISFEYFQNMSIRLLVNSATKPTNATGDLIVTSLSVNSKANCRLDCAISSSFA
jgi:hypothetical protein